MWYQYRNLQSEGFQEMSLSWMKDQFRTFEPRVFGRHILGSSGIGCLTLEELKTINRIVDIPWLGSVQLWSDWYQGVSTSLRETHGQNAAAEARQIEDAMVATLPGNVSYPQLFLLLVYAKQSELEKPNLLKKRDRHYDAMADLETRSASFGPPKTESSSAPIDLSPNCLSALKEHQRLQALDRYAAGERYQDLGLVFATATGGMLDDRHISQRVFGPTLKKAHLEPIRLHDLRHTTASLLISQGENPKYIQKQMRHSSIQMTFDRYGHLFPDINIAAGKRLDATIFGGGQE